MKSNIVTSIEPQVNSNDRLSVFIDGEFAFGISYFDLYNLKIKKGDIIDKDRLLQIEEIISVDKCKNYAINLVSRKMYTEKEITDKLKLKGFSQTAISEVISILKEYGYVNDELYTKLYVQEYMKKYGSKKLEYNLKQKGISQELILTFCKDIDNNAQLLSLIKSKARNTDLTDSKMRSKIIRHFLNKGFSYDDIITSLRQLGEGCDYDI